MIGHQIVSVGSLLASQVLPSRPAVYLVFSGEKLLYIGSTSNLNSRWKGHDYKKQFRQIRGLRVAWLSGLASYELVNVENWLISKLQPLMNKDFKGQSRRVSIAVSPETRDRLRLAAAKRGKAVGCLLEHLARAL